MTVQSIRPCHQSNTVLLNSNPIAKQKVYHQHAYPDDGTPPIYQAQVDRDAFMDTFGPYFASQLKQAVDFLTKEVNM